MGFKQQRSRDLSSKLMLQGLGVVGLFPIEGLVQFWVSLKMWIPGWLQSILYMAVFSREDDKTCGFDGVFLKKCAFQVWDVLNEKTR